VSEKVKRNLFDREPLGRRWRGSMATVKNMKRNLFDREPRSGGEALRQGSAEGTPSGKMGF